MKRVLALLMAVLMLACGGSALADEERELTFQGVPWGSSFQETMQSLLDSGLLDSGLLVNNRNMSVQEYIDKIGTNADVTYLYSQENKEWDVTISGGEYVCKFWAYSGVSGDYNISVPEDKTIAGYGIDRIEFSFVKQGEDTRLMTVQLHLDYQDAAAAYEDLRAKLSSVYGEGEHSEAHKIDTWSGANHSMIFLRHNGSSVELLYGTTDAEEWMKEAEAAIPKQEIDGTDVSGL